MKIGLFAAGVVAGVTALAGSLRADVLVESFDAGIPTSWLVEDYQPGGSGVAWNLNSATGRGNYTGGAGAAAMADANSGGDGVEFDVALLTPILTLPAETPLELRFLANYQNFAGHDFADVDINDGSGWANLLRWNEDHGDSFFRPIGESVAIGLDEYAGREVQIRFHYYDPGTSDWDYYWQIDDVVVTPTPGAGVLAVLGVLMIGARRRRRG